MNFHTIGADADLDGDTFLCSLFPIEIRFFTCDFDNPIEEDTSLLAENFRTSSIPPWLSSIGLPNVMYRNLASIKRVASVESEIPIEIDGIEFQMPVVTITGTSGSNNPIQNDTIVTVPSAHGIGAFGQLAASMPRTFFGSDGANHATIGSIRMFSDVVSWVWSAELSKGDHR